MPGIDKEVCKGNLETQARNWYFYCYVDERVEPQFNHLEFLKFNVLNVICHRPWVNSIINNKPHPIEFRENKLQNKLVY